MRGGRGTLEEVMIEPVASSPVPLRPAIVDPPGKDAASADAEAKGRTGGGSGLKSVLRLLRHLPSFDDVRRFVVNTIVVVALGVVVLVAVVAMKAGQKPATVIDAIGVPKDLQDRGYTPAVVAQRLIDEIAGIERTAASFKEHTTISSLPFESKVPKIDLPLGGMSLGLLVSELRELWGIVDTRISGEIIAEPAVAARADEKGTANAPGHLSLRLRIMDRGTIHVSEPAANLDALLKPAALKVVEQFDAYIAAVYYYVSGDLENAWRVVQPLLVSGSEEKRQLARNLRGLIKLEQKRYDEALAIFTDLIKGDEAAFGPRLNRAKVHIARGDAKLALEDALGAIQIPTGGRERAIAHTVAADALLMMEEKARREEALSHLGRSIEADPRYARAYFMWGRIYRTRNDYDNAIDMFTQAAHVDPQGPDAYNAYMNWGETLNDQGRLEQARRIFDRAVAVDPKRSTAYHSIGALYLKQSQWDKSAEYFHRAISIYPSWSWYHLDLARSLAGAGKLDQATAALERATTIDPNQAFAYAQWGRMLADAALKTNGKPAADLKKAAAGKLARAVEISPKDGDLLKEVGKAYEVLGQPARAADTYQAALDAGGGTDEALRAEIARLRRPAR